MGKVINRTTYWRDVLAPKLLARKRELGRAVPERRIAFEVAQATGQDSSRSLLAMWFRGEREPTVSQFLALCERMDLSWSEVLSANHRISERKPARRVNERASTHITRRKQGLRVHD